MSTRRLQAITVAVTLLPAASLAGRFATRGFGPEPVDDMTHVSGEWALRFLLLSLAVTPARRLFGWSWAAPLRRTLGLAAFGYALVHLLVWAVLDLSLDPAAILEDATERVFVTAGLAGFTLLFALAVTSTRGWMRRLGKRWGALHRAAYAAAVLGVLHHFWLIKADYRPAIVHGVVLAALLGARAAWAWRARATPGLGAET